MTGPSTTPPAATKKGNKFPETRYFRYQRRTFDLKNLGLYIHFPFCRTKCPYCHFYSVPYERHLFERWREALGKEASRSAGNDIRVDTLYIGGGTPSLLGPDQIFRTRETLRANFCSDLAEFTLEANPDVRDEAFLQGGKTRA